MVYSYTEDLGIRGAKELLFHVKNLEGVGRWIANLLKLLRMSCPAWYA